MIAVLTMLPQLKNSGVLTSITVSWLDHKPLVNIEVVSSFSAGLAFFINIFVDWYQVLGE